MTVVVLPQEVLFDGRDLLKLGGSERFLEAFGQPTRQRNIPMHPSGTRVARVWDSLGLVAYEDQPERQMSHCFLALSPTDTPECPQQASQATIEMNGGIVTAETTDRTLPRKGPTPISVDSAKHFSYTSEVYAVHFAFGREPDPRGRGILAGRLHYFSFTWIRPRA